VAGSEPRVKGISVNLDLVEPVGAARHLFDERRKLRLEVCCDVGSPLAAFVHRMAAPLLGALGSTSNWAAYHDPKAIPTLASRVTGKEHQP
jgi:hypothetical protein